MLLKLLQHRSEGRVGAISIASGRARPHVVAVVSAERAALSGFRVGYLNDCTAMEKAVAGGATLQLATEAAEGGLFLPRLPEPAVGAFVTCVPCLSTSIAIWETYSAAAATQGEAHRSVDIDCFQTLVVECIKNTSSHKPWPEGDEDSDDLSFRGGSDKNNRKPEGYVKVRCWRVDGSEVIDQH